jgi:putative ABC transport system permease protein
MRSLRLLRLVSLRHLRRRPLRAVLAIVAVAAGTAMAVSVFVVRSSVERSVDGFGQALAGPTELRVVGAVRRGGLESSVAAAVARTEGVAAAVPMVQAITVVELPRAHHEPSPLDAQPGTPVERSTVVLGVDCGVEALVGEFGCTDAMVGDAGDRALLVGPGVDRSGALRTRAATVGLAEVARSDALAEIAGGNVVVFGLETAQRLFGRGDRLDVVYVRPGPGVAVDDLRATLTDVVGEHNGVLDATQGPPEIADALGEFLPLFTLLALFALGTGAMLVYNTVSLTLEERRRDLAVVGALGGSRSAVAGATLGEAAVTGAAGGVLGSVAAVGVAGPIVDSLSGFTQRFAGVPLELHVAWLTVALGVALGTVLSVLAAAVPVRRALRADVAAELSGRDRRREVAAPASLRRAAVWAVVTTAGLGCLGLGNRGGGLDPWQVPVGAAGFAVTAVGLLMCSTALATLAIRPLGRLAGDRAPAVLAVANLVRNPRRTGVMAASVAVAVVTAFVTAGYSSGLRAAFTEDVIGNLDGVEVSGLAAGANANLDTGLPVPVLDRLAELPGVAAVHGASSVLAGADESDLVAVIAYEDAWLDDGEDALRGTIDVEAFDSGEALINASLARDRGLRPGDVVRLPTPRAMVEVPVQAVVAGGGPNDRSVLIPWDLHRQLYGPQPQRTVTVEAEPGVDPERLARSLRAAELGPSIRIRTPAVLVDEAADAADRQMAPFWVLQRGLLAVSFVAVLSTLLLAGVQRRRELALLGAVGFEPGALGRMVVAEAAAVVVAALVLSTVGGLVMLWAVVAGAPLLVGFASPYAPDWGSLLTAGAGALVVTLAASLWPARRAARTDVVAALQDE